MKETESLLSWYDDNRRTLPWREDPTPYHVWVSEIMLQQTRVEAVKGYYARFLRTLPTVADLAAASEDTCLKLWEGLGYYSRVRNMHKAAVTVMEQYGGELPRTAAELQKLPGIGPYTSKAIASIAYREPEVAVDGNLIRVFARRTCYGENSKSPQAKKDAAAWYEQRLPADRPGDYNQALMDLGATICLPNGAPLCSSCPWQSCCSAHKSGRELQYPVVPPRKERRIEKRTVLVIRDASHVLLRRRPEEGLLAGLYEFPSTSGWLSRQEAVRLTEDLGLQVLEAPRRKKARHVFSHLEWHMVGYEIIVEDIGHPDGFLTPSFAELANLYSVPSAFSAFQEFVP